MTSSTLLDGTIEREELLREYGALRAGTTALCEPLATEDMVVQTMPDVSPTKWHLAHTTWFFETFVLAKEDEAYRPYDERWAALFNSYYRSIGDPYPRSQRGLLSRPTVDEVLAYRRHVDAAVASFLEHAPDDLLTRAAPVLTIGMHHEQQHQELLLMDAKHVLTHNPLKPAYRDAPARRASAPTDVAWHAYGGGRSELGLSATDFGFDNERPRHQVELAPFELASRAVTCGEFLRFQQDGGYERPELWLSDGFDTAQREGWTAPLYWERTDGAWRLATLAGSRDLDPAEPVCHVSFYEADAYARWAGCRLPSEAEWEHAAARRPVEGNFLEGGELHPRPAAAPRAGDGPAQMFGDVWEWTASPYAPYPGYAPFQGELGEYNGKFMINQLVLRGGCCVTPRGHVRPTYRNFYYPHQRWMFAGFRLAR